MRALLEGLVDLVFPPRCCACERWLRACEPRDAALCESCRVALPWIEPDACCRCQERVALPDALVCAACRPPAAGSRPLLASCTAAVRYQDGVERWIARFKYPERGLRGLDTAPLAVARFLAREAAARAPGPLPAAIVPIPLHARRLRRRGFNPAALVAREVARATGARLAPRALWRLRDTPSQTGLDRRARRTNVRAAFAAEAEALPPARKGPIWLVDDVVTTGATLEEAAHTLQAGGERVLAAVCLARTPPGRERDGDPRAAPPA